MRSLCASQTSAMVTGIGSGGARFMAPACSSRSSTACIVSVAGSCFSERMACTISFQSLAGRDHGRRGDISLATLPGCYEKDYSVSEERRQYVVNLACSEKAGTRGCQLFRCMLNLLL